MEAIAAGRDPFLSSQTLYSVKGGEETTKSTKVTNHSHELHELGLRIEEAGWWILAFPAIGTDKACQCLCGSCSLRTGNGGKSVSSFSSSSRASQNRSFCILAPEKLGFRGSDPANSIRGCHSSNTKTFFFVNFVLFVVKRRILRGERKFLSGEQGRDALLLRFRT